jgi:hypothetical protein
MELFNQLCSMAKEKKPVTQIVTTVTPTGDRVAIYIGGKLIAITPVADMTTHELNQN